MTADGRKPPEINDFHKVVAAGGVCGRRADGPGEPEDAFRERDFRGRHAAEIAELVDAIRDLPEIRSDRVAAIRTAIESGTYVVDAQRIAQKMIDDM